MSASFVNAATRGAVYGQYAAPTQVSYPAVPTQSSYAVAAPAVSYTPSYAPAPVAYAAPAAPAAPVSVLANMPDPGTIEKQKQGYIKMLDDQLKEGNAVLSQQMKYQQDYLHAQADQQKKAIYHAD